MMTMTKRIKMTSIFLFFFWYCSACKQGNTIKCHPRDGMPPVLARGRLFTFCNCFKPSSVLTHACSTLKSILSRTVPLRNDGRLFYRSNFESRCRSTALISVLVGDRCTVITCSTTIPAKSRKISLRSEMDWTICLISRSRSSTMTVFCSTSINWSSVKPWNATVGWEKHLSAQMQSMPLRVAIITMIFLGGNREYILAPQ